MSYIVDWDNVKVFDELWQSWVNGNLTHVADKVAKMKRSRILGFVVYLIDQNKVDIIDDIESLARMLHNRNL